MFARRNFVHQRAQNGVHQDVAARLSPALSSLAADNSLNTPTSSASPSASADPLTTNSVPSSVASASKTTDPSPASSSASSSSSNPATTSSSASAASLASASTPSSSASHALSFASSTPLTVVPTTATQAPVVTTPDVLSSSFTPTSSLSPSTTSTTGTSSGVHTGVIIGAVAGALAGIAVLGFLLMWCMRRQHNGDIDDFDAQAFKRQSAILVDDPIEPPRSYNSRPLTMLEHNNASPALAAQAGFGGQNFYGNYAGYSQQPQAPPEMVPPTSAPPQAYGATPINYSGYNDFPQQLSRQPSNAAYLTRQPSSAARYTPPPVPPTSFDPGAHYIDLNRSSVSPYQAAQYADISRHLGTTDPNGQVPPESLELPDDPLPSPFDDPVQPSGSGAPSARVPSHGPGHTQQRPVTVYEDGDAYGGI